MKLKTIAVFLIAACAASISLSAQNPIIKGQFSADPSAHVFEGRVYVYPSHDIPAPADYARKDWFCMADYHVYSSDNLVDWVDYIEYDEETGEFVIKQDFTADIYLKLKFGSDSVYFGFAE